jgi:3-oxoacyl-[acyl-carrier-protein] synthase III
MGLTILGIGMSFPQKEEHASDVSTEFPEWPTDKILEKTGIDRRFIAEDQSTSDLAVLACEDVFTLTNFDRSLIDYVLLCTQSPDYFLPSTACIVQNRLGLSKNIGAFDFNLGCSGYVYGLGLAEALLGSGQAKNVLLITSETYSKYVRPDDRSIRTIFGDGASATILTSGKGNCSGFVYGTDGSGAEHLMVKDGAAASEFSADRTGRQGPELVMNGPKTFEFGLKAAKVCHDGVLSALSLTQDDVDYFIFHQASKVMLDGIKRRLAIPDGKFCNDLLFAGNTVSSTIPIALKRALEDGLADRSKNVMLIGFGVGLSWAGCLLEF